MIHKFFVTIWEILFGVEIREFVEKRINNNIIISKEGFRPWCDYSIFRCFRSTNPKKVWYVALLHYDGEYYRINADAYTSTKTIIQENE